MKLVLQIAGGIVLAIVIISMVSCGVSLLMLGAANEAMNKVTKNILTKEEVGSIVVTNAEKNEVLITEKNGRAYTSYEAKRIQDEANKKDKDRISKIDREEERKNYEKKMRDRALILKFDDIYKIPQGCLNPPNEDIYKCIEARRKSKAAFMMENGIDPNNISDRFFK